MIAHTCKLWIVQKNLECPSDSRSRSWPPKNGVIDRGLAVEEFRGESFVQHSREFRRLSETLESLQCNQCKFWDKPVTSAKVSFSAKETKSWRHRVATSHSYLPVCTCLSTSIQSRYIKACYVFPLNAVLNGIPVRLASFTHAVLSRGKGSITYLYRDYYILYVLCFTSF